jgi:hypothetical protein
VKNPAACCGASSKEKANMGAAVAKLLLAIHRRSKLWDILAFSRKDAKAIEKARAENSSLFLHRKRAVGGCKTVMKTGESAPPILGKDPLHP